MSNFSRNVHKRGMVESKGRTEDSEDSDNSTDNPHPKTTPLKKRKLDQTTIDKPSPVPSAAHLAPTTLLASDALKLDHLDSTTPFKSFEDIWYRLVPFHVHLPPSKVGEGPSEAEAEKLFNACEELQQVLLGHKLKPLSAALEQTLLMEKLSSLEENEELEAAKRSSQQQVLSRQNSVVRAGLQKAPQPQPQVQQQSVPLSFLQMRSNYQYTPQQFYMLQQQYHNPNQPQPTTVPQPTPPPQVPPSATPSPQSFKSSTPQTQQPSPWMSYQPQVQYSGLSNPQQTKLPPNMYNSGQSQYMPPQYKYQQPIMQTQNISQPPNQNQPPIQPPQPQTQQPAPQMQQKQLYQQQQQVIQTSKALPVQRMPSQTHSTYQQPVAVNPQMSMQNPNMGLPSNYSQMPNAPQYHVQSFPAMQNQSGYGTPYHNQGPVQGQVMAPGYAYGTNGYYGVTSGALLENDLTTVSGPGGLPQR